jgi:hypothetical protein
MDFLKKHYEKILLGVVLVGLAVAVAFLPFKIASEKQRLEDLRNTLIHPKVKPLTNLDLTVSESALKLMATPAPVEFSPPNKLFNPMPWQQTRDTPPRLIRSDKAGPTAAVVTNITPLYLRITFDSVNLGADGSAKYVIGVQKEASPVASQRNKKQSYLKLNDKNETFTISAVNGAPENPTNVVLTLNDTGDSVAITKDLAFKRVDGYMADIRYDPERKSWSKQRVGSSLSFNGEDYIIVAITQNEVVLSAKSNQKKWTIKPNASP